MVPDRLRAEVAEIAARAAAAGRPLDLLPVLEVAACRRQGSAAFIGRPGRREPPRVRLAIKLLSQAPTERAWTIAHELSHVLRAQEGTRVRPSRARLVAGAVLIAAAVLGLATAGYVAVSGGTDVGVPLTAASGAATGMYLVLLGPDRAEEAGADVTAAKVFGEVLSVAGVERMRRDEGVLVRYAPTVLRTHPHPAARRAAGLAACSIGD